MRGGTSPGTSATSVVSRPPGADRICSRGLLLAVPRRCGGFERVEEASRNRGDLVDGGRERGFVSLRWLVEATDFSHELQRSRPNLLVCHRRFEVEEGLDISAHGENLHAHRAPGRTFLRDIDLSVLQASLELSLPLVAAPLSAAFAADELNVSVGYSIAGKPLAMHGYDPGRILPSDA